MKNIDLASMSNSELNDTIRGAEMLLENAWGELNRWEVVRCVVCDLSDLSYRGELFITWSKDSGYILCPKCSWKFKNKLPKDLMVSPKDEIMALLD